MNGKTLRTETRIADGKAETIYIHHGPVSNANTTHVLVHSVDHLGIILVDGRGRVLYAFVPDAPGASCDRSCMAQWPPMRLTIEMTADVSPALEESLLATELDPERHALGDRIVTFDGHVLHTFVGDTAPFLASGQGAHSFGGHWYVITRSGALLTKR